MSEQDYRNPLYLVNGMHVFIDCRIAGITDKKPGTGLRCIVETAHGDRGLIVNEHYGFVRLMSIDDMYVPPGFYDEQYKASIEAGS